VSLTVAELLRRWDDTNAAVQEMRDDVRRIADALERIAGIREEVEYEVELEP
jgi:hypothetical protein